MNICPLPIPDHKLEHHNKVSSVLTVFVNPYLMRSQLFMCNTVMRLVFYLFIIVRKSLKKMKEIKYFIKPVSSISNEC